MKNNIPKLHFCSHKSSCFFHFLFCSKRKRNKRKGAHEKGHFPQNRTCLCYNASLRTFLNVPRFRGQPTRRFTLLQIFISNHQLHSSTKLVVEPNKEKTGVPEVSQEFGVDGCGVEPGKQSLRLILPQKSILRFYFHRNGHAHRSCLGC